MEDMVKSEPYSCTFVISIVFHGYQLDKDIHDNIRLAVGRVHEICQDKNLEDNQLINHVHHKMTKACMSCPILVNENLLPISRWLRCIHCDLSVCFCVVHSGDNL